MTQPTAKRADQLVVGDRIQPGYLPAYARSGEGRVMLVDPYAYRGADWVFIAFACADGDRNCAYYLPDGTVEVLPADPTGQLYSRADDGEQPGPVGGRIPPHFEDGRAPVRVFACTAHGIHPHLGTNGEPMTCLDCPQCRPPGSGV